MKVIQLITAFQLGGAEKIAMDIALELDSNIHDIQLLTIFKNNSKFSLNLKKELNNKNIKYRELGIETKYTKLKYIGLFISIIQTFFFLFKYKPDIIHSHTDLPDFVLSSVMKIFSFLNIQKPKIIRTIHNTQLWPSRTKIAYYVEKSFSNDNIIFISKGAKAAYCDLRKRCNLNISKNTFFISNGVNINNYTNKCVNSILKHNNITLSKDKINFLFVGRFVEQKGFDLMLESFKLLEPKLLNSIKIYAFGSGTLETLIYNDKYSKISLNIFQPTIDLHLLYGCFDFLFMPSRFEGLPLVALESLASKLPIVASNAPGLIEAIPDNWPLQFQNEDIHDMHKIIVKIIEKDIDINLLKDIGRKFVEERYNIKKMINGYIDIYKKVYLCR
jgi:glycosyltransferase involved in cell wall biosynthesis